MAYIHRNRWLKLHPVESVDVLNEAHILIEGSSKLPLIAPLITCSSHRC